MKMEEMFAIYGGWLLGMVSMQISTLEISAFSIRLFEIGALPCFAFSLYFALKYSGVIKEKKK